MKFTSTDNNPNAISESPTIPEQRMSPFMDLPVEIHQRIIAAFLTDLYTTFDGFKALRLICRRFDAIVKPRVYSSNIRVFRKFDDEHLSTNADHLLTLLSSKPNEQLHATTTLILCSRNGFHGERIKLKTTLAFAKLRLYLPISQFNLPNVTHVVWDSWTDHPMWLISRIANLLRRLPRLCEFSLIMYKSSKEFHHLVGCVVKFHNLRKLSFNSIRPDTGTSFSVAKIIAANPNLTHLEVFYDAALFDEILYDDPSEYLAHTLRHLPADPPLKLEHLRLSRCFHNLAALAPHISSLTSIDIANSEILNEFLKQNIFPPTMTFRMMDQYTINYLNRHPRIVSLTNHGCNDASTCSTLLGILSRHSETLTHLGFCHSVLYNCIDQMQNELAILQCTNLKQLLLDYQCNPYRRMAVSELQREKTLSVICRLPDSLTLVVNEKVACAACSRFCSRSQNPLLRNLARRIVL